jgi:hypothetical protein
VIMRCLLSAFASPLHLREMYNLVTAAEGGRIAEVFN